MQVGDYTPPSQTLAYAGWLGKCVNIHLSEVHLLSSSTSPSWLDSVLGQSKQGVFTADFEGENNTMVELGDGDSVVLDCKVYLKQEKTVR